MGDFTYTVFVIVASMAGTLLALFVGVVAAALMLDTSTTAQPDATPQAEPSIEYRHAA